MASLGGLIANGAAASLLEAIRGPNPAQGKPLLLLNVEAKQRALGVPEIDYWFEIHNLTTGPIATDISVILEGVWGIVTAIPAKQGIKFQGVIFVETIEDKEITINARANDGTNLADPKIIPVTMQ